MNTRLAKAIAAFVAHPDEERAAALEGYSAFQWRRAEFWLHTSGLALYLLDALRRVESEGLLPAQLATTLQRNLEENQERARDRFAEFGRVVSALSAVGIPFICDKGFSLVPEYCPDPALRMSFDFDFLVPPGSLDAFDECFRALGYQLTARGPETVYETCPGEVPRFADLYKPSRDYKVELQSDVVRRDRSYFHLRPLTGIFHRKTIQTLNGVCFPVLSRGDTLLRQALHILAHATDGWLRVAWLVEFQRGLQALAHDEEFWPQLRLRVQGIAGYSQALGFAELLAAEALEGRLGALSEWARREVPEGVRRWIEEFGCEFVLRPFPGSKLDLLLLREVLGTGEEWRQLRRRRLFPLKRPRVVAYSATPDARKRVRAWRTQVRFLGSRVAFHLREGVRYGAYAYRWNRLRPRPAVRG